MADKPDPVLTASRFVQRFHPDAQAAFVGGSVLRGQGTATSDLDLVVIITAPPAPYRETRVFDGWIVEGFFHSVETLTAWTGKEVGERRPVLAQLITEGEIVADRGPAAEVRSAMRALLDQGPAPLSTAEIDQARYGLGDSLDDLADSPPGLQRMTAITAVVDQLIRLELDTAGHWSGSGKWIIRRLGQVDPPLSRRLSEAAERALVDPAPLVALVEDRLTDHGGRLTDGYRADGAPILERWHQSQTDESASPTTAARNEEE